MEKHGMRNGISLVLTYQNLKAARLAFEELDSNDVCLCVPLVLKSY